jgi:hypothetical protein
MMTIEEFREHVHNEVSPGRWTFEVRSLGFLAYCGPYAVRWRCEHGISYNYSRHRRTVESTDLAEFLAMVEMAKGLHRQAVRVRQELAKPAPKTHFRDRGAAMISTCGPYGYNGELFEFFRPDSTTYPLAPVGNFLASLHELTDEHARNLLACVGRPECTRIRAYYTHNMTDLFALIERVHGS